MNKKNEREPISKKMRFEVFKRDSFTCQYCGKKSPDVILEADHIEPVSKGGKTVMLNLVTSCFKCNRGKSNVKLSDTSVIEKQKKALIELNEKQEQLKMLLKWRSGLLNIESQELQAVSDSWLKITTYSLNDFGTSIVKKLLKQFGLRAVLEALDISSKYLEYNNGVVTRESVEVAFNKAKGICYIKSLPKDKQNEYQVIGSLKIAMRYKFGRQYDDKWVSIHISKFLKDGNSLEKLKDLTDKSSDYWNWVDNIQNWV